MRAIWQLCSWKLVKNSFLPETTLATTKNVHELIFWTIIGFLKLVAIKFGSISSSLPFLPTMGLYSVFAHQVLFKSHDLTWKDIQMQNLVAISLSNKTNTSTLFCSHLARNFATLLFRFCVYIAWHCMTCLCVIIIITIIIVVQHNSVIVNATLTTTSSRKTALLLMPSFLLENCNEEVGMRNYSDTFEVHGK